jgi:hypothetical protein
MKHLHADLYGAGSLLDPHGRVLRLWSWQSVVEFAMSLPSAPLLVQEPVEVLSLQWLLWVPLVMYLQWCWHSLVQPAVVLAASRGLVWADVWKISAPSQAPAHGVFLVHLSYLIQGRPLLDEGVRSPQALQCQSWLLPDLDVEEQDLVETAHLVLM